MDYGTAKAKDERLAAEEPEEVLDDIMPEDEEDTSEDDTLEEDLEEIAGDEVKPVRQASFLALPILIRCAEARGNQAAAEAYQVEYEIAKKDRVLTEEAKKIVARIEEGIHSGAALSKEGLRLDPISEGLLAKVAALFGGQAEEGELQVEAEGSLLTLTAKGAVTVQEA